MEERDLHRSLHEGVEVETYGPPDFGSAIGKQSGINFESFDDERYGESRDWMNPKIHPQFVFNPPVYLNVEDAYKIRGSHLEILNDEIYEYGTSTFEVSSIMEGWLKEKYQGRRKWFEENNEEIIGNVLQDEYVCICDGEECNYFPEGFVTEGKEEFLSFNAFLTLFDYSMGIIDMDCEILGRLDESNWNDAIIEVCIDDYRDALIDDWGGAGGKNNPIFLNWSKVVPV